MRAAGAVPATVGILDGELVVGLSEDELRRFGEAARARKVGARDLAACCVQGALGATTVGGTLAAVRPLGIEVMATGGLGGVHREFPRPPDVSSDLGELARTRAVIVSCGVKSLLDVPATSELLETLGIPVLGYRTDTLPLFYAAAGGPPVSARVESAAEAAAVARAHWELGASGRGRAGAAARAEPRRRRAADRGGARRGRRAGRARACDHAVRARAPARAQRRPHAARQPRADRRQRGARRRGRRRRSQRRRARCTTSPRGGARAGVGDAARRE